MSGLSEEQSSELNKVVLAYLKESGYTATFDALKEETKLNPESKRGILCAKWRSIVKLQKQIKDLEKAETQLKAQAATKDGGGRQKKSKASLIPCPPAKFECSGHKDVVTSVKFHPSGNGLAFSCSTDGLIKVWDVATGKEEQTMAGHQDGVTDIAFHPSGSVLASCSSDTTIKLWDLDEYKCTKTLTGHTHNISNVVYAADGKSLISCGRDNTIKIWDTQIGVCRETLTAHTDWVTRVVLSPDGKQFTSCGFDLTVMIWDIGGGSAPVDSWKAADPFPGQQSSGKEANYSDWQNLECIAWSNALADKCIFDYVISKEERNAAKAARLKALEDGKEDSTATNPHGGAYIITGSRDNSIRLWDVKKKTLVLELKGHKKRVLCAMFHPGGQFILSGAEDKTIRVWDLSKQGECVKVIEQAHEGGGGFVQSIDCPKHFDLVASCGSDKMVKFWPCK
mmetsp:Transcript_47916/g.94090  ORF Transcript_47916/g.94090 Transcript_47916/m.94090 type:complete len:453 (+) Transcript_47916:134-1492(+)|eukprot:CAMPEP_0175089482 /NCGR_PEP_ID=MMETSP0086_2-20121207/809_1 /TAXON_ID=136419 /ORGANISM="Unknown Unknown, Strain D1" /LENGTH=452 /DNA_ID=CAMNT_0016361993 /DNA_START=129 /DNA_END=1487 /DNA_ORIENTATION=-